MAFDMEQHDVVFNCAKQVIEHTLFELHTISK